MIVSRERASKIILGVDPAARVATALDVVRCILPENVSELQSVFLEDLELLEHARSRLAREIPLSGSARPLESTALSRQMRAQSALARRELEAAAATLGIPHTFSFAGGERLIELATQAAETDTLVVTIGETLGFKPVWRAALHKLLLARLRMLMLAREGWQRERNVVAIVSAADAAAAHVRVARRLSEQSRSRLSLIVAEPGDAASTRVGGIIGGEAIIVADTLDAVVEAVRRARARAVVVPWRHADLDLILIDRLLSETPSALLLVGE